MKMQRASWGYIEWLYLPENNREQSLSVGICVILPGERQEPHVHYEEQFLYILSGELIHAVDGIERILSPGAHIYLPPGVLHESRNAGNSPVRELMVSCPVPHGESLPHVPIGQGPGAYNLRKAVHALQAQFDKPVIVPYVIRNHAGEVFYQNDQYQDFCVRTCDPSQNAACPCFGDLPEAPGFLEGGKALLCPYGLTVYHLDILHGGQLVGSVRGGNIFILHEGITRPSGVYDAPESTALGIQRLLHQLVRSILLYFDFEHTQALLQSQDEALQAGRTQARELEKNLLISQNSAANLWISHHFLFNTLNCMADMAVGENNTSLYNAILDLAKMFRYTMSSEREFVCLRDEWAYLQTYVHLQQLRYGGRFRFTHSIDESLFAVSVPFNFMQPMVENCFVHGFRATTGPMDIHIRIQKNGDRLSFSVTDNGKGLDAEKLTALQAQRGAGASHGLSMLYDKFRAAYGDKFVLSFEKASPHGLKITLQFPIQAQEGDYD